MDIRFGGLLQSASKELHYELFHWLVTHYDVTFHTVMMENAFSIRFQDSNARVVMGIPCFGEDILVYAFRACAPATCDHTLIKLEKDTIELHVGDQFKKIFLVFSHVSSY